MISAKRRLLLAVLSVVMVVCVAQAATVFALSEPTTIAYPFQTGTDAFQYAPTWTGATELEDYWQFFSASFADTSVDDFDYLAIQLQLQGNSAGFTVGALSATTNARLDNASKDGEKLYFVAEDGTVSELSVLYGSITLTAGSKGTLLLPKASLTWRFNEEGHDKINAVYFTTNALYNRNFTLQVGEVGYYKGELPEGKFTKLLSLKNGCQQTNYYVDNSVKTPVTYPQYKAASYPFRVGDEAFANAPTWQGATTGATTDTYQFLQPQFAETDLSEADYLAIQVKVTKGTFGFTVGAHTSNGGRYGTFTDKKSALKLVSNDGTSKNLDVLYASVTLTKGDEGMLLIPMDNLSWVSWANDEQKNLAKINSVFFESNAKYNFAFEMVVGDIGYYVGEPGQNGSIYTSLLDLSAGEKKTSYYVAASTLLFPSEAKDPNVVPETVEYPFAKGDKAYDKAVVWAGTSAGDTSDNWQTFSLNFDETANLSDATWLVVQYKALSGTPGITYGVQNGNARYSISGNDGTKTYMISEDGKVSVASQYQYDASVITGSGALLINFNKMGWQFGSEANKDLTKVKQLIFTTNSRYNWNFEIVVGEVGYYTGTLGEDAVYHKLVDVSKTNKLTQATATSDNAANRCSVRAYKVDRTVYGDVTLSWLATGKTASSFAIWEGGSYGTAEMVTDSYGDDAVKLTATGANPTGDQYVATTIGDGLKWQWGGAKGVTLWARNDSDIEVSFNLEMDVCNNSYTNTANGHNARFNIKQGNRFILYDVNTEKQTIYMTRPCVTLPVGFEGWVFVPFTAFNQADWSVTGQGAMPVSLFRDDNNAFAANSWVSYMAVTVHAPSYQDKPFSLNKIGSYKVTPSFVSAVIPETETAKSVPTLMDLPKEDK